MLTLSVTVKVEPSGFKRDFTRLRSEARRPITGSEPEAGLLLAEDAAVAMPTEPASLTVVAGGFTLATIGPNDGCCCCRVVVVVAMAEIPRDGLLLVTLEGAEVGLWGCDVAG